ncbi:MAG TPA: hypothetical protein VEY11_10285 [Pyrinomonadaceae bacterium]|nr:hypothetical protein [Pyrinomonadaceae bacterium]
MKRTQDKIKDLVEPQEFDDVRDFAADPARALAAYRFTDATSDLLARWLDALADLPRDHGAAHALAGMRGVGKSHTLATFGALIAAAERPNAQLADAHVAASARRLANRRHRIVRVGRGTRPTLRDELIEAFIAAYGGNVADWAGDPAAWLAQAAVRSSPTPATLVILIDTAFGREARVKRDDGPLLSELAVAARDANAFVALALDDDIAGAEGVNVALARTFRIDYLEPEHLYHVANIYVLRKNAPARDALHEIYLSLRQSVPNFNWSEPRFAALYPVHPLVADTSSSVRLYAPAFAFLPFAAAAARNAVNRPALSLILLDEVFDHSEDSLRRSEDLRDAFRVYDELATKAVAQFPAMQRLQVRLVLKSLFVLSLDGRGATARDLCAALLFQDEVSQQAAVERVEETLKRLTDLAPARGLAAHTDGEELRYRFQVSVAADFDAALAASSESPAIDDGAIAAMLRTLAPARFEDWPFADEQETPHADFRVTWRGSARAGRLTRPAATNTAAVSTASDTISDTTSDITGDAASNQTSDTSSYQSSNRTSATANERATGQTSGNANIAAGFATGDVAGAATREAAGETTHEATGAATGEVKVHAYDWQLSVHDSGCVVGGNVPAAADEARRLAGAAADAPLSVAWQPAECYAEELSVLRRLVALRTDASLAEFGETARAAASSLAAQAERIWSRLYVDDGRLLVDGESVAFTPQARAGQSLAPMLAGALAPHFAARFPQHPEFTATPNETDIALLVDHLFGGGNVADAAVQQLAETFAVPLGLATRRGDIYIPETGDAVLGQPWVREVLARVDRAGSRVVPLASLQRLLGGRPYGLSHSSQHLVLAALVAQRRIELVTTTDDRISRRTLGSSLKWDEVAGVCRAAEIHHNAEELTAWARLLAGDPTLASIADADARESVRAALSGWLADWRAETVLKEFDALPDAGLTTRAWDLAAAVRRTFGAAADAVADALDGSLSLEEGLQRVADVYGDAPAQLTRAAEQLAALRTYTSGIVRRESVRAYLSAAEQTTLEVIESARRELLLIADDPHSLFDTARTERFELLWQEFQACYAEHYTDLHARAVGDGRNHMALDEFMRGAEWRDFEALAGLPFVAPHLWEEAASLAAEVRNARCDLPVARLLAKHPRCACAFRLARAEQYLNAAALLAEITERGRAAYRRTLARFHTHLAHALKLLAADTTDAETAGRAYTLAHHLAQRQTPPLFTHADARLITLALQKTPRAEPLRARLPAGIMRGLLTRDELATRWQQWFDELPYDAALFEIMFENNSDAA